MSKILLDYAVSFTQVSGTNATSLDFLHNLGVIVAPSSTPPTATITNPSGTTVIPATFELTGLFLAGTVITIAGTKTDIPPLTYNAPYTLTEDMTATQLAVAFADFIAGNDQMTATANGNVVELLAINGGLTVGIDTLDLDETGVIPQTTSIIEVVDPGELEYLCESPEDVQAAFDGGLNSVYLIITSDITEVPDVILEKECDFFTIYASRDFAEADALLAMSQWQGVQGLTFTEQAAAAAAAATNNVCAFFEDTTTPEQARAYFGIYSFANLLASNSWRNQQYIPINPANGNAVTSLGLAESLFNDRISFYLTDAEQGTRLAFFVAGGKSITDPYIDREVQVVIQNSMLNYLAATQPMNIETNRRQLEVIGNNILIDYASAGLLDPDGTNTVNITKSNEAFIVDGEITTANAEALWRVQLDALESVAL